MPPHPIARLHFSKLAPMDSISMDFAQFHGKYFLIVVDLESGYTMCAAVPDQTTETALKFLKVLGNQYGYPSELRSDGGPAFRLSFEAALKKLGISHHTSPPYVPASNGLAERGVGIIKSYLYKLGKLQQPELSKLLYHINNIPSSTPGAGSAFFRFCGQMADWQLFPNCHSISPQKMYVWLG